MDEMVEAFEIGDVNPNPARFDLKKAEAINAAHMRLLPIDEMTSRVLPFLKQAGVVGDPVGDADAQLLELAMPLVAERINKLTEAVDMLGFLFVDESAFTPSPTRLDDAGRDVVQGGVRRARPGCRSGARPRSRRRCVSPSSRGSASSRASRSGRCASPSPAARSRRRSSSRWSCSAASGASAGSPPSWGERADD